MTPSHIVPTTTTAPYGPYWSVIPPYPYTPYPYGPLWTAPAHCPCPNCTRYYTFTCSNTTTEQ